MKTNLYIFVTGKNDEDKNKSPCRLAGSKLRSTTSITSIVKFFFIVLLMMFLDLILAKLASNFRLELRHISHIQDTLSIVT